MSALVGRQPVGRSHPHTMLVHALVTHADHGNRPVWTVMCGAVDQSVVVATMTDGSEP
jgi:hypothetical protein